MLEIAFEREEDFDTEQHQSYREDGWIGGSFTEVPYLLSCLTRFNYFNSPNEVWEPAAKEFISTNAPTSSWIKGSHCFHPFAVLILKDLYRQSRLGQLFPIRKERTTEVATRFVFAHPDLGIDELSPETENNGKATPTQQ